MLSLSLSPSLAIGHRLARRECSDAQALTRGLIREASSGVHHHRPVLTIRFPVIGRPRYSQAGMQGTGLGFSGFWGAVYYPLFWRRMVSPHLRSWAGLGLIIIMGVIGSGLGAAAGASPGRLPRAGSGKEWWSVVMAPQHKLTTATWSASSLGSW
eukprot:scaffold3183_cov381-Prasinococcus_capsulatus_cf.AAC.14